MEGRARRGEPPADDETMPSRAGWRSAGVWLEECLLNEGARWRWRWRWRRGWKAGAVTLRFEAIVFKRGLGSKESVWWRVVVVVAVGWGGEIIGGGKALPNLSTYII